MCLFSLLYWEFCSPFNLLLENEHVFSCCRCFGVSPEEYEQQRSTSVKSKWVEPVCQPAPQSCQYTQHWHNAHASLAEQVQHKQTFIAWGGILGVYLGVFKHPDLLILAEGLMDLIWMSWHYKFVVPPPPLCRGILPMSSRSVLNHSQQVGGPTGQTGGMVGGVGGERGGGGVGAGRSSSMGSPSRSSPSIIGMPKQQQARQPFTINR